MPATALPLASFTVTVSVVVEVPSAVTVGELATMLEVVAEGPFSGSICRPENVVNAPAKLATLPARSSTVAPFGRLTCVIASAETVASLAPTV